MSAQLQAMPVPCGVSEVEESFDVAIEIARRGYGMPVIRLAVVRKGLAGDSAYVVAVIAQRLAKIPAAPIVIAPVSAATFAPVAVALATTETSGPYESNQGAAAVWALQSMSRFLVYVVLALGGGLCLGAGLGWEAGFVEGTEESMRRVANLLQEFGLP